jgi:hypothetical protein
VRKVLWEALRRDVRPIYTMDNADAARAAPDDPKVLGRWL